jgi:thioesterase domain-containing protein
MKAAPVIVLSGAGGGAPDLAPFRAGFSTNSFAILEYPGWRRYVEPGFSLHSLVEDLMLQIESVVPNGPVRIIGISIGAHFGYAVAVRLQAAGREISGFCAVDAFMLHSAAPSPGWLARAFALGSSLICEKRIVDFVKFVRSRFWRAMLRLSQDRLVVAILRKAKQSSRLQKIIAIDPLFEHELSMRLLLRSVAPGIAALDREPIGLNTSAALLRTGLTADSDQGWRRRCPGIKIFQIPGNHETMLEPQNFSALSDAFNAATRDCWSPK